MKLPRQIIALVLTLTATFAGEPPKLPVKAPALLELRDQYDAPQRLTFPATNVVILTIADRKGSEQIEGWVTPLKERYGGRIDIRGLADVGAVPGFWHGKVQKKFQETRKYPVMMDWSGTNCAQFGFQPSVANVLVIARDGTIGGRFAGPATDSAFKEAQAAIDAALAGAASTPTNSTPGSAGFGRP
jgi:hypothetical protein